MALSVTFFANRGQKAKAISSDIPGHDFAVLSFQEGDRTPVSIFVPSDMADWAHMVAETFNSRMNSGALFRPENDLSALIQRDTAGI